MDVVEFAEFIAAARRDLKLFYMHNDPRTMKGANQSAARITSKIESYIHLVIILVAFLMVWTRPNNIIWRIS